MSRFVWPYFFTLRAAELALPVANQEAMTALRTTFLSVTDGIKVVALRWATRSDLGFPRQPFQIFRRQRNTLEEKLLTTVVTASTLIPTTSLTLSILPGGDAAYVVLVAVTVTAGSSVTVQAIDLYGQPIPNEAVTLSRNGIVEFRCPGIGALSVTGGGSVGPAKAIGETVYANLPDWTQIQTVGLPLLNKEIGASYDTTPQGFWPNALTPPTFTGVVAAEVRMFISAVLQLPPPATGIADFPLPAWPAPNPAAYIANIRSASNIVPMIERCLEKSVDTNPALIQALYTETVTVDGLSQVGVPVSSPPSGQSSQVNLPITGIAMLAVSTDSFASVALGYGTVDLQTNPDVTNGTSPAVSIAIAPISANVAAGKTQQLTATVTGASKSDVIWSVNGVVGGNAALGTVTKAGLYTAPSRVPASTSVTVAATSEQDPSKSATASLTVVGGTVGVPPTGVATPTAPIGVDIIITTPITLPPSDNYGNYDYMITAPFTFPFGLTVTLAALSTGQPPVTLPEGLSSSLQQVHAPLERDQGAPAAIQVSWQASAIPQGYGILASRAPNQSQVLNSPRPTAVGGYDIFVGLAPANSDPNTPPDQQNPSFSDVECALPRALPDITNRYLVAGQDVFGLWSGWIETSTTLLPAAVTKPGLRNAQFILAANAGSPPSQVVPATLRVDFGWDWQDRAPGQIRFTGQFVHAPATTLNPPFLSGFAMKNSGPIGPPVILTFNYTSVDPDTVDPNAVIPVIDSGHTTAGPVVILGEGTPPAPPANPQQVQYRVDITGLEIDFSAANEVDFLIYATATEEVQPGIWSDPTDQVSSTSPASPPAPPLFIGKIVRAINPNPPVVTFSPPAISWTALPDATGMARGVLQWVADPNAAGYFVWEATESALLHILPPGSPSGTPDAPADTPYTSRATTLKNLVTAYQDASLRGFARLTQAPIPGNRTEIVVPGFADTLYVYRISAIGANNVEAPRSDEIAIFAVPRRNVPGTPRIMLRSGVWSPPGIQVIVLPVESSAPPAGYRLFRVRNEALAQDGSTMGPAKIGESNAAWRPYSGTTLAGNILSGESVVDTAAIASWYPYYYRATAIGENDLANGLYSGESGFSNLQTGYVLPPDPPLIAGVQVSVSLPHSAALITLTTDLPAAAASPVGPALVELLQLQRQASPPGPLELVRLLFSAPDQIAVRTLTLPLVPLPPNAAGELGRSAPDEDGRWTLSILIHYEAASAGSYVLRLTDPQARQSNTSF